MPLKRPNDALGDLYRREEERLFNEEFQRKYREEGNAYPLGKAIPEDPYFLFDQGVDDRDMSLQNRLNRDKKTEGSRRPKLEPRPREEDI